MGQYTEYEINQAIEAVGKGMSLRKASIEYGIPKTTLRDRLHGTQPREIAFEDYQRLSIDQEAKLAEWVRIQHALGLAPIHQQVKVFAERILHAMGDTDPLGKQWIQGFKRRNPSIKVQRSRPIDSRRINGASTEVIRDWFNLLAIPEVKSIKPSNRYNMDETGILEGQGSNGLVLGMFEMKSVRKKQPGSRAWVSIIECISALGHALDPLIIYKGKTVQQQWFPLDLGPYKRWQFTATENGWTTDDTAVEWLQKVFIPQTLPQGKEEARLLVADGHGTAQHKLELLQAQVASTAARKRRAVQLDPNTKFANIKDIQQAQIEAGEKEDITDGFSVSDLPSEAESCIVVASGCS
ncbi:transposase [Colletotrichum tabaci]|uniref:Transposase n=1 Tax=Colletotrichum tabaci TaxID=1209068 RepID=A0AAV9TJ68_9PEZI